jgi:hypothetical protein
MFKDDDVSSGMLRRVMAQKLTGNALKCRNVQQGPVTQKTFIAILVTMAT